MDKIRVYSVPCGLGHQVSVVMRSPGHILCSTCGTTRTATDDDLRRIRNELLVDSEEVTRKAETSDSNGVRSALYALAAQMHQLANRAAEILDRRSTSLPSSLIGGTC